MITVLVSILLFESVDVSNTRDSTIQQIMEGRWEDAITNAKFVLTHQPEDDLLLGLLRLAKLKGFVSELNPKFMFLLDNRESEILRAWETLHKKNPTNTNILHALAIMWIERDTEKARSYANKILESDSSSTFAYFIMGYTHEHNGEYDEAIRNYHRSWHLDTTSTDCIAVLANVYLMKGNFDSALVYYRKIPYDDSLINGMHIGEIICELKMKNVVAAESIISKMKSSKIKECLQYYLDEIDKYIANRVESTLSSSDSFIVSVPLILRQVYLHQPGTLAAVLSADTIKIVPGSVFEIKPKPVYIPKPQYPESARKANIEGNVVVKVLVDIDGRVIDTEVLHSSGYKELDNAATEAARKAIFEPAMQFGRPVRVWVSIPTRFVLTP